MMVTQQDLKDIQNDSSADAKSAVAIKVSDYYQQDNISEKAQGLAEDIFRIMVKDVEYKVREAVAVSLQNSKTLPKDIVKTLVKEVDSISIPFIKKYQHFSNEEIIEVLSTDNVDKDIAVALRKNLSYEISDYIVHNCHSRVVEALIINKDAKILEETFTVILNKYSQDEKIKESLVNRAHLPIAFTNTLINYLSNKLLKKLIELHQLPNDTASDVVEQLKEKAILKISEDVSTEAQIEDLVNELYQNNRLTSSLIVRSICMGDIMFFEYGLALLSNTKILDVRKVLANTKQDFVIRNLLRKAYIPKTMFPAIFSALDVVKELKLSATKGEKEAFPQKVIERILSYSLAGDGLDDEDVKYLISRIG